MSLIKPFLIGIPFEGEDDFIKGTSLGPSKIRWAMDSIENFSCYQNKILPPYTDLGDIYLPDIHQEKFSDYLERNLKEKLEPPFVAVGGNHLITLPLVRILKKYHPELRVIHFDAHLDRRERYKGFLFSYSTVIRRLEEEIGRERIFTLGYRSKSQEEDDGQSFRGKVFDPPNSIIGELENFPLYLTLDLDVLDPSEFPAVSNPEPGGISFLELIDSLKVLRNKIVAADIVEFNPMASFDTYPAVTAAILVRELLIIISRR